MRRTGIIQVLLAALCWGAGGTIADYCFRHLGVKPDWLVTMRMLVAGMILLSVMVRKNGVKSIFFWKKREWILPMLVFSTVGMFAVQSTYFFAIEATNSAVATLLQYLAPLLIVFYFAIVRRQRPSGREMVALSLALIGLFFVVTNGSLAQFSVSTTGLLIGLLGAVVLAFYTVYPVKLLAAFPSMLVVGWAMLIGGFFAMLVLRVNLANLPQINGHFLLMIALVVLVGTIVPFYLFTESLRNIDPQEASLIATIEPVYSVIAAVLVLGYHFHFLQFVGSFMIIVMVVLLSLPAAATSKIHKKKVDH